MLANLIKKGTLFELMTATPATPATSKNTQPSPVAKVATVAVACNNARTFTSSLMLTDVSKINSWLASIGETDKRVISDILELCRHDLNSRRLILEKVLFKAEEVNNTNTGSVRCINCEYFQRSEHPNLGNCLIGETENIGGLWDTDRRHCRQFSSSDL